MLTTINPQGAHPLSAQSDRFHALDAVRAFALILGIFFHGTMSFISYIGHYWAIRDTQSSVFLDGFNYITHSFRMQVFFLIAGYFAHLLYHRQGPKAFLTNRIRRILKPFLIFLPITYLFLGPLWFWGHQLMGLIPKESPAATQSPLLALFSDFKALKWLLSELPFAHLWFLYYLMLFCLVVFIIRPVFIQLDKSERIRAGLDAMLAKAARNWWGGLMLGVVLILPTLTSTSWAGVDTPYNGFIPLVAPFSVYGLYFTIGYVFHRQPVLITELKRYWKINFLISFGLLSGLATFFLTTIYANNAPPTSPAIDPTVVKGFLPITSTLSALAAMTAVFFFIGCILTYFSKPSLRIRYLSDSAYWLYIAHLPVVIFFQIIVAPLSLHWLLKMPLIFGPSFTVLLLSYHYGVRNTWIGMLLNGRRHPLR